MIKNMELPICMPMYTTYNYQGMAGIVAEQNKSLKNWFYNNSIVLNCNKVFLKGYTTPELGILYTDVMHIDEIEKIMYDVRFIREEIHTIIKNMLNKGYYVCFNYFDDYYIEGKSLYNQRHLAHDGLIYGYDDNEGTYSVVAYNNEWIYTTFTTSQRGIEKAMNSIIELDNIYGYLLALKATEDEVKLDIEYIKKQIKEYLKSDLENCSPHIDGEAIGIVVHEYINMYLDKLINKSIPYDKTDKRIFRLLWEHKKCMLERIQIIERTLNKDNKLSKEYELILNESNKIRNIYIRYNVRKDENLLIKIQRKVKFIMEKEREVLKNFINMEE